MIRLNRKVAPKNRTEIEFIVIKGRPLVLAICPVCLKIDYLIGSLQLI